MGILQELWADRIAAAKDDGGDKTPYIVTYKLAGGKTKTVKKKAENVAELKDYYKKDFVSAEIDYEKLNEADNEAGYYIVGGRPKEWDCVAGPFADKEEANEENRKKYSTHGADYAVRYFKTHPKKLNEGEKLTAKDAEVNGHTWMVKFTHCPGKTDTRDYTIRSVKAISSSQAVAAAKAKLPADVRDCAKVDNVKLTDKKVDESADLAKKLVRGEKGPKGLLAKLDHWFTGLLVQKNADRFLPAPSAVKALKSYGFSDDQVHKIREAAAEAAQTAIERMQTKYGDEVPAKYISKMGSSFNVFDLYLNVSEKIHNEFAALMRRLFDAKIDKMKSQLEIVKEDSNLQSLGKSLKGGKVATADEEPEAKTDVNTPPDQQEPAEEPAEEKPEFKIGDIVKPLKGPHKDEPHDVVKVFDDGSIGIKPKVDDEANKYKAKQAKAKPDEVVLAESVKYRGLFAKGPLLVQLDDRLMEAAASSPKTLEGLKAKKEALLAKMDNIVQAGGKIMMNDPLMKQLAMVKKQIADLKKPVAEAVAGPLTKFKKGQKVTVKKTGEEVTVISQSDSGLVFTMSKDAVKIPDDKKLKAVPGKGYKEYMPRELEAK